MKINVTQQHIDDGKQATCCACPVALAINSPTMPFTFPRIEYASVHLKDGHCTLQKVQGGPRFTCKFALPEVAQKFVVTFQRGKKVAPIEFEIDMGEPILRLSMNNGTI